MMLGSLSIPNYNKLINPINLNDFIGAWNFETSGCLNTLNNGGLAGPLNVGFTTSVGVPAPASISNTLIYDSTLGYGNGPCIKGSTSSYLNRASRSQLVNPINLTQGFTISGFFRSLNTLKGDGPFIVLNNTAEGGYSLILNFGQADLASNVSLFTHNGVTNRGSSVAGWSRDTVFSTPYSPFIFVFTVEILSATSIRVTSYQSGIGQLWQSTMASGANSNLFSACTTLDISQYNFYAGATIYGQAAFDNVTFARKVLNSTQINSLLAGNMPNALGILP
jgi:hypothetical protein